MAVIVWLLMALTGGFAFWPAIMKGIRMTGTDEEQGRIYGIFEALNGFASLLLSFIMIGIMAIAGKGDLVTGFKSALACMGGLSLVSGLLVLFLMPKNAEYGASAEENAEDNKITVKDYLHAFKIPGVLIMAILVWGYVTISAVASYLTPYSTDVLGMSAVVAASIGTIRTYGCRLVGGPLGGVLADDGDLVVEREREDVLAVKGNGLAGRHHGKGGMTLDLVEDLGSEFGREHGPLGNGARRIFSHGI